MKTIAAILLLALAPCAHASAVCQNSAQGVYDCQESNTSALAYVWYGDPETMFASVTQVILEPWHAVATCAVQEVPVAHGTVNVHMPLYDETVVNQADGTSFTYQSIDDAPATCFGPNNSPVQFADNMGVSYWDFIGQPCASPYGWNGCDPGMAWFYYMLSGGGW